MSRGRPKTCAIYVRLSPREGGDASLSPQRQESDARALAKARGWEVVRVYSDLSVSAFKRGIRRPQFEQMIHDAEAGDFDVVVIWKLDRFVRNLVEFVAVHARLEAVGVSLASVNDPIDTTSPTGRAMLQIIVVFAELESATTRLRVKGAITQNAREGRSHGRGHRPFGYTMADEIVPAEAEMITEAAARFLAGDSLAEICRDWTDRGLTSPTGKAWISQTLSVSLANPRLAGFRRHRSTEGEHLYPATWAPILDEVTFARLAAALGHSRSKRARRDATASLLGGIIRCSDCGHGMHYNAEDPKVRAATYRVGTTIRNDACARSIMADQTDAQVWHDVRIAVLEAGLVDAARDHDGVQESVLVDLIAALTEQSDQLARDHYIDGRVSREMFVKGMDSIRDRIADATDDLDRVRNRSTRRRIPTDAAGLDRWWKKATIVEKRALILDHVDHVAVSPVMPERRNRFDPDRITIAWRTST